MMVNHWLIMTGWWFQPTLIGRQTWQCQIPDVFSLWEMSIWMCLKM